MTKVLLKHKRLILFCLNGLNVLTTFPLPMLCTSVTQDSQEKPIKVHINFPLE